MPNRALGRKCLPPIDTHGYCLNQQEIMVTKDVAIMLLNGCSQVLLEVRRNPQILQVHPTQTQRPQYQHNLEFQMLRHQLDLFQVSPMNLNQ